jgi:hypothetical protein
MTTIALRITGCVDTHLDVHVVAGLDQRGALLALRCDRHARRFGRPQSSSPA